MEPLAARLRPRSLDDLVGQEHLTRPGGLLRTLLEARVPPSAVLWGPPGSGKTTVAMLLGSLPGRRVVHLTALTATVKDLRAEIQAAGMHQAHTVLFVDEVHRFSRTQQDALLAAVEHGEVSLLAATTEHPSVSVAPALLSRCLVVRLRALSEDSLRAVLARASAAERLEVASEALDHLVRLADGDARRALTLLEAAAGEDRAVALADVERAADRAAPRYVHAAVTSAFIKSIRGSDADAAMHWLARMLEAGEDPRYVARRLVVLAAEDVGLADPAALGVAVAAAHAVTLVGMPEARLPLAQAVLHLALAPKSDAVIVAVDAAIADVRVGIASDGITRYRSSHDDPRGVLRQAYVSGEAATRRYYAPTGRGAERTAGERYERLRSIVRGDG